jgi:hypothetical protein
MLHCRSDSGLVVITRLVSRGLMNLILTRHFFNSSSSFSGNFQREVGKMTFGNFLREVGLIIFGNFPTRGLAPIYTVRDNSEIYMAFGTVQVDWPQ